MEKASFKERFNYWFDKRMSKGTSSIIKVLAIATLLVVLVISFLICLLGLSEDSFIYVFWDSLASTINAWMPYSSDGDLGYLILTAIAALIGVLFTSVLIGVVGSFIEDKINDLRKGNSLVLEKDHIVVLGFQKGEYALIQQLIEAAHGEKRTILVSEQMERDEMEDDISDNIDIPDNISIICRNIDNIDPVAMKCLNIQNSKVVAINENDNNRTVKTVLAVLTYLRDYPETEVKIVSKISDDGYILPEQMLKDKNIIMIQTNDVIARIISHASNQPGLSYAYGEFLDFEGDELYFEKANDFIDKTVSEIAGILDKAIFLGYRRDGKTVLNPDRNEVIQKDDEVILFEEYQNAYSIAEFEQKDIREEKEKEIVYEEEGKFLIIGFNEVFETVLQQLPENVRNVVVMNVEDSEKEELDMLIKKHANLTITVNEDDALSTDVLETVTEDIKHIIILGEHNIDDEDADVRNILILLKLRDIKRRFARNFSITTELVQESSRNLVKEDNNTEFVVASHLTSMMLAQLVVNPELRDVFRELLSNEGNELFVKSMKTFNLKEHDYSINSLRRILLSYGYCLLGYVNDSEVILNPALNERISLRNSDGLIVLGDH